MIQQALQFLTDKRRLITEYVLLGCVVTIGGLAFSMWISRAELRTELANTKGELVAQTQRVSVVEQAYDTNRQAIEKLQGLRDLDAETFKNLQKTLDGIQSRNSAFDKQLELLKVQNEEAKAFFAMRLNRAVICVLEPQQCGKDDLHKN